MGFWQKDWMWYYSQLLKDDISSFECKGQTIFKPFGWQFTTSWTVISK